MNVKQLISKLKKFPPESVVVWQDHDNDDDEYSGTVATVEDGYELYEKLGITVVVLRG